MAKAITRAAGSIWSYLGGIREPGRGCPHLGKGFPHLVSQQAVLELEEGGSGHPSSW